MVASYMVRDGMDPGQARDEVFTTVRMFRDITLQDHCEDLVQARFPALVRAAQPDGELKVRTLRGLAETGSRLQHDRGTGKPGVAGQDAIDALVAGCGIAGFADARATVGKEIVTQVDNAILWHDSADDWPPELRQR
jgi:hypothetical protein